ncbi:MAG: MaoC/PaaZ C-terminal domain-containing protein [Chloroflexota bacterium]
MSAELFPFEAGRVLPLLELPPVTRIELIKYAGASGDFNPIHTVDDAASAAGLPGVIQHGMLTAAKICRLCSPYLARGFVSRVELRFAAMVVVGDVLSVTGMVSAVSDNGGVRCATVEVAALKGSEQVVASGQIDFTEIVS